MSFWTTSINRPIGRFLTTKVLELQLMTIERRAAEPYVPQDRSARRAFDRVVRRTDSRFTSLVGLESLPPETITAVAKDHFRAAVGYFANNTRNSEFDDIGTRIWQAIDEDRIDIMVAPTMGKGLRLLGQPNLAKVADDRLPVFVADRLYDDGDARVIGTLVCAPNFILAAQSAPIDILRNFSAQILIINDFLSEQPIGTEEDQMRRVFAAQAQFWLGIREQEPGIVFSKEVNDLLERLPQGFDTFSRDELWPGTV